MLRINTTFGRPLWSAPRKGGNCQKRACYVTLGLQRALRISLAYLFRAVPTKTLGDAVCFSHLAKGAFTPDSRYNVSRNMRTYPPPFFPFFGSRPPPPWASQHSLNGHISTCMCRTSTKVVQQYKSQACCETRSRQVVGHLHIITTDTLWCFQNLQKEAR